MIHPKFIQITASAYVSSDGDSYTQLYSLSEDGEVYEHHVDGLGYSSWDKISEDR